MHLFKQIIWQTGNQNCLGTCAEEDGRRDEYLPIHLRETLDLYETPRNFGDSPQPLIVPYVPHPRAGFLIGNGPLHLFRI
jgi:hypothetical protein